MSELGNRKRGFEDSDTEYEPTSAAGASASGERFSSGGEGRFKRPRRPQLPRELEVLKDVCQAISQLGDPSDRLEADWKSLSKTIADEFSNDDFQENFLEHIYAVATEQPHKVFAVSGLVQSCNARNPAIGAAIVDHLQRKAQEILDGLDGEDSYDDDEPGVFTRLKLVTRLLAVLSPILVSVDPVLEVFRALIQSAVRLQAETDSRSSVAELVYYSFTLSIPYILTVDRDDDDLKNKCEELFSEAEKFEIRASEYPSDLFQHFRASNKDLLPNEPTQLVSLVGPAVKKLDLGIFSEVQERINNVVEELRKEKDDGDEEMKTEEDEEKDSGVLHELNSLTVPPPESFESVKVSGTVDSLWVYPRYILEIFQKRNSSFSTVPPVDSYESLIIRDLIQDLVQSTEFNRITVSRQLLALIHYVNDKLFAKPNSSEDKLTIVNDMRNGVDLINDLDNNPDIPATMRETMLASAKKIQLEFDEGYKSTWKMEQTITESVLDLMFHLPISTLPAVYYQTLLADTCGRDWTLMRKSDESSEKVTFAKTIGAALRFFYKNSRTLDFSIKARYVCWMLVQISNFNFDWQWSEWVGDASKLSQSVYHPTIFLLHNIIAKEVRVSTPKLIRKTLPDELKKYTDLSLMSGDEIVDYDSQLFGVELAKSSQKANSETIAAELNDSSSQDDLGNAEIFHLLDQYLFNNQEHRYHDVCHSIYTNMQEGESMQSFNDLVAELKEQILGNPGSVEDVEKYIVTLIVQSVCIIGSRSLSVIEGGALELCGDRIREVLGIPTLGEEEAIENDQFSEITNTAERQKWLIEAVLRLWNNEPRVGFLILEKMRNKRLVKSSQIIASLFEFADHLLVITEIYADELLDRLLFEEAENESESKEEKQSIFATAVVQSLGKFLASAGEENYDLEDDSFITKDPQVKEKITDVKWAIRQLILMLESKLRRIRDKEFVEKIEEAISEEITDNDGVKKQLLDRLQGLQNL
ncbi:DEKNAAC102275 [Brettanomyces naardenensis]|uniref:DEKNAAC102275 n=1 Tax=Brettanomyces naardenensis TaxID=13370 RepID=A0A448YL75_BRENA|nr:DEKNAAC102275 [Brettanomyces naardenensis]